MSKSFYCQPPPVLPSPTSSWYQTTLRLTDSIYLSLGSKSGHKAMCASDSQGAVMMTPQYQKLEVSELESQVCPT